MAICRKSVANTGFPVEGVNLRRDGCVNQLVTDYYMVAFTMLKYFKVA